MRRLLLLLVVAAFAEVGWTSGADSGVGTQFEVADVNGDGLLDVVTSNKKGVFYFEQTRG